MIYDIIIDTLLFGASGYITNKYVMDMLLNEYPISKSLKIGGKLKVSKKQFIKNVSNMMEKDILSSEKISEKFKNHDFSEEFTNFSKDFFNEFLCRDMKSLRLKDIPIFYDACCGLRDIAINLINTNIGDILNNVGSNIKLSELVTDEQTKHISKNLLQNLILTIKNTNIINDISHMSIEELNDIKLSDIISKDLLDVIKSNIEKEAHKFNNIIKDNFSERIDLSINEILKQNKLDNILKQVQNELSQKPLKSYINVNTKDIAYFIRGNLLDFLSSEKGEKAIFDMYDDLKDYIIERNISLLDLYNVDYEKAIKDRLNSRINNIAYSILKWIGNNNTDLDNTIKESIGEFISGNPELKSKIFSTIKSYFDSKKNEDGKIVRILVESEVNNENLDKISSFINLEISNKLKEIDAKAIINRFEDKKVFNDEILTDSIKKYIKSMDNIAIEAIIDDIISMPLSNFINLDLVKLFNDRFKYIFIDYIKQNTYYSTEIHTDIVNKLSEHIFKSFNEKLAELLDKDFIDNKANKIKKLLLNSISENENALIEIINSKISEFTNQGMVSDLFSKLSEFSQSSDILVSEKINELIQQNLLKLIDDIGDIRVSKLLTKFSSIPDIHNSFSDFMKNIAGECITIVNEGYVRETVDKHFENLNDLEFASHIKDTNSINTKKINITGGIIGAAVGLPLSYASYKLLSSSIINNVFSWQGMALGTIIGLPTNFIAMNAFSSFRNENSIIAKIPVLKNIGKKSIHKKQMHFADYMANIIENIMIDEETIQDLVQSKSTQLKNNISNTISNDDYSYIYNFLNSNKEYFSKKLSDSAKELISYNTDSIARYISNSIADTPIKSIINRNLIDSLMNQVSLNKDKLLNLSSNYISKNIIDNLTLLKLAPNKILNQIMDETDLIISDNFNNITSFLKEPELLRKYLSKYEASYKVFLNKNLIDTFSHNTLDDLYYSLYSSLYSRLITNDSLNTLSEGVKHGIVNEFINNKKLGNLFDRRIKFIISSMFFKYFNELIVDLHEYMSLNRHTSIEKDIKEKLLSNLSLKEKISYNAIGADATITNIINSLIQVKIPLFVERNLEQFYDISKNITEDILDVYLEEIDISLNNEKLNTFINGLFIVKNKVSIIKNKGFLIFNSYMKKYSDTKIKDFAKHMNLGSIKDFFSKYEDEISFILKQLSNSIKKNKDSILKSSSGIFEQISVKALDSILVKDLFKGADELDLTEMKNSFSKIIEDSDLLYLNTRAIINSFYNYLDDRDLLSTIIDINDINLTLDKTIKNLSNDKEFFNYIQELYSKIISNDLKFSVYINLGYNVKKYFTELLTDAFYLTIKKNLSNIYNGINLDEIAKEEIMRLSQQDFQGLYNIFWKNNFRNTIWTGLAGGLLGLNRPIGIVAVSIVFLNSIRKSASKFTLKLREKLKLKKDK